MSGSATYWLAVWDEVSQLADERRVTVQQRRQPRSQSPCRNNVVGRSSCPSPRSCRTPRSRARPVSHRNAGLRRGGCRRRVPGGDAKKQNGDQDIRSAHGSSSSISGLISAGYGLFFHRLIASGTPLSSRVVSVSTSAATSQCRGRFIASGPHPWSSRKAGLRGST